MTEWSEAAKIAFGLMVAAFVMTLTAYYMYVGKSMNNEMSRMESTKTLMKELRDYSGYNNKVVYAQDVASLIMEKRGAIAIQVTSGGNQLAYWADSDARDAIGRSKDPWTFQPGKANSTYTTTAISEKLNLNKAYKGYLTCGYNGEVLGVTFKVGTQDADGNFTEE